MRPMIIDGSVAPTRVHPSFLEAVATPQSCRACTFKALDDVGSICALKRLNAEHPKPRARDGGRGCPRFLRGLK